MQTATHHTPTDQQGALQTVASDLAYMRTVFVNVYFYGNPNAGDRGWTLIDTGVPGYTGKIKEAAAARFGKDARPAAIILTHGHFDHVGTVQGLAEEWDTPVYAHEMELPYLTGRSSYPPPDPTIGGGAMTFMSPLYPRGPIDLGTRVQALPVDGSVPGMAGWRWIHTPGHSPGHVSLFRDTDRTLVAGDAFVTVKAESAMGALSYRPVMHGPPAYFTPDWTASRLAVRTLADLEPEIAATGHGLPLRGQEMRDALHELTRDFERLAVPDRGRYINEPAVATAEGVVSVPPPVSYPKRTAFMALGGMALLGLLLSRARQW